MGTLPFLRCPHPPSHRAAPELFEQYASLDLPRPPQWRFEDRPRHPVLETMRHFFHLEEPFDKAQIAQLPRPTTGSALFWTSRSARAVHARFAWPDRRTRAYSTPRTTATARAPGACSASSPDDESAAVRLILAGPDVPVGRVVETPVSLVYSYPDHSRSRRRFVWCPRKFAAR